MKSCSENLYKLNQEIIELRKSTPYALFEKRQLFKRYIRDKDFSSILNHIYIKFNKNKFYSLEGNRKYIENSQFNHSVKIKNTSKIAVYSVVVGNYDEIRDPYYINEDVDYLMFTDQNLSDDSCWKKVDITKLKDYGSLSDTLLNRKIKLLSHKYLKEYDYTIYVDGTIRLITDVVPQIEKMGNRLLGLHTHASRDCAYMESNSCIFTKKSKKELIENQIKKYRLQKFPEHYGLFQNSIIFRKKDDRIIELEDFWWRELLETETRDQISLPYSIWSLDFPIEKIYIFGEEVDMNANFMRYDHIK